MWLGFRESQPRRRRDMRAFPILLGMDAVRVAWTGAVCSFVCDACANAIKNRLNRACAGNVGVVGF